MSISYETTGRVRQKARTREAIVTATRRLLAEGQTPTVEDAADAAGVSRATAYRYFPNQRGMLVAAYPEIEARTLLGSDPPSDVATRVDVVVDEIVRMVIENEPELRTMLRLSLEADAAQREQLVLRQGRAIGWLEDALRPLRGRVPSADVRRLVYAIRTAVGIEAFVWLRDVAGLSTTDAADVMRWSAHRLLASIPRNAGTNRAGR